MHIGLKIPTSMYKAVHTWHCSMYKFTYAYLRQLTDGVREGDTVHYDTGNISVIQWIVVVRKFYPMKVTILRYIHMYEQSMNHISLKML